MPESSRSSRLARLTSPVCFSSVGFCLFKMADKGKVESPSLWKEFDTAESANNLLKLSAIHRFSSTAEAVEDATSLSEGKMSKSLKNFLTQEISGKDKKSAKNEELVVVDPKLGALFLRPK